MTGPAAGIVMLLATTRVQQKQIDALTQSHLMLTNPIAQLTAYAGNLAQRLHELEQGAREKRDQQEQEDEGAARMAVLRGLPIDRVGEEEEEDDFEPYAAHPADCPSLSCGGKEAVSLLSEGRKGAA